MNACTMVYHSLFHQQAELRDACCWECGAESDFEGWAWRCRVCRAMAITPKYVARTRPCPWEALHA